MRLTRVAGNGFAVASDLTFVLKKRPPYPRTRVRLPGLLDRSAPPPPYPIGSSIVIVRTALVREPELFGFTGTGRDPILSLLLCTSTGIVMVVMAVKRGKIVPPVWKRSA